MGLKSSEPYVRRLNNDVGGHIRNMLNSWATLVSGLRLYRPTIVACFVSSETAALFGTFATVSALFGHCCFSHVRFAPTAEIRQSKVMECLFAEGMLLSLSDVQSQSQYVQKVPIAPV